MADLSNLDVAVLIDFSGTMATADVRLGSTMTRLESVKESCFALCKELEAHDDDGITVVKFASKVKIYDGVTAQKVNDIFMENRAMGGTNTKDALDQTIQKLLAKRAAGSTKPICLIVFTDGKPDEPVGVAQVIVNATKQIKDRSELGILFIQVGNDPEAADYLEKLNDHLTDAGAALDIVAVEKLDNLEDVTTPDLIEMAFTA